MAYATQADMEARYSARELIERTNAEIPGAVAINATVLATVLNDGAAEIDGFLGGYSLPLANVPPLLTRINCALARAKLYSDAVIDPQQKPAWLLEAEGAYKTLEKIASGLIQLQVGGEAVENSGISAETFGPARVFDDAGFRGY